MISRVTVRLIPLQCAPDMSEFALVLPLTPNASIATDPTSIPTGTITLLNAPGTSACKTVSSMAVAQDIGGRIKGPHIRIYTGGGPPAGTKANSFNNLGFVFMPVPKETGSPVSDYVTVRFGRGRVIRRGAGENPLARHRPLDQLSGNPNRRGSPAKRGCGAHVRMVRPRRLRRRYRRIA
jgi:3D domain-containing protein